MAFLLTRACLSYIFFFIAVLLAVLVFSSGLLVLSPSTPRPRPFPPSTPTQNDTHQHRLERESKRAAAIVEELASLYDVTDVCECSDVETLEMILRHMRETQPITHGEIYGRVGLRGNQKNPTGAVVITHGLGHLWNFYDQTIDKIRAGAPHLLFILPVAPPRRATVHGRRYEPSWYDIVLMNSPDVMEAWQDDEAILNSVDYLSSLSYVMAKKFHFSPENIIYGGFSQGAAISVVTGLLSPVPPAGVLCFSGYLPGKNVTVPRMKNKTPIVIFHGREDYLMPFSVAEEMKEIIDKQVGPVCELREYHIDHNVNNEEIADAIKFINRVLPKPS